MRRFSFVFSAVAALAVFAIPADAQIKFGAHGAVITGLDEVLIAGEQVGVPSGTFGLGARAMIDPPLLPVALVASGTYYFDDGDESVWTGTLAGQLRIPLPIVKPYVTAGYQIRPDDAAGNSQKGFMIGAGLQLDLAVSVFLEGGFEIGKDIEVADLPGLTEALDTNRLVVKGGVMFGG